MRWLIILPFLVGCSVGYNVSFAPPHNEPVIGNKVARYRVELAPTLTYKGFEYQVKGTAWGVNTWRRPADVGHFPDSWSHSDWTVDEWRYSVTQTATYWMGDVGLFAEHYQPFGESDWGGHGLEDNYYLLMGVKGTWRPSRN